MKSRQNILDRLAPMVWLVATIFPLRLSAIEGIPHWENVLTEMLDRVGQQPESPIQAPQSILSATPRNGSSASRSGEALRPVVESFVRYFQGTGAKRYRAAVNRLQAYLPMISHVLREEGLPPETIWVGLVESGYDPGARSPKNALGMWQLMPETATTFGLTVAPRDERTNPEKSTRSAARYLKFLYGRFGDWALTLAAYNAGERRVQEAIERVRDRDFWRLAASGALPRETQAYVPAVLAAQFLGAGTRVGDGSNAYGEATARAARVAIAPFSLSR